ncbi:hypothetical protein N7539_001471 [Penicillium diatomitis]|uniref:Uncharacterized protein n=1 Tax=Penicillium diatomitis TaxID=2819901 RepID=A0A9W9XHN9_9EURO|nr:uncharacterized protein N7539_001471 [Penicillium diatomitis]KAJ5492725.1 hypothetical protein N7539_001471 [Penicillium diatomitis]
MASQKPRKMSPTKYFDPSTEEIAAWFETTGDAWDSDELDPEHEHSVLFASSHRQERKETGATAKQTPPKNPQPAGPSSSGSQRGSGSQASVKPYAGPSKSSSTFTSRKKAKVSSEGSEGPRRDEKRK